MAANPPLIIVGGGLAGCLAALCLAQRRPDIPLLLLESGDSFGGNHTWSFFDSDIPPAARDLIAALKPVRWPRHRVRFPGRERELAMANNSVDSSALDALVKAQLPEGSWRLNAAVHALEPNAVVLLGGERIAALGVIDARGPDGPMPGLELGWQKFVGIEFAAAAPEPDCPMVMDATVPQIDGYRFVYVLPFTAERVLVEDTYYSDDPVLDVAAVADRVRELARERGLIGPELRQETGVLPILIGGDPAQFWPDNDPIARLGLRGGFFHATTGYSFNLALRLAVSLAERNEAFDGKALAAWTRGQFVRHWQDMRFFRVLNRMLFGAAEADQRYRIFEHFYRLAPGLIARFYAGTPKGADRMRILSGRPPVPIGAAIKALLRR